MKCPDCKFIKLGRVGHFSAAHQLLDDSSTSITYNKCSNLHGHNYRVIIEVERVAMPCEKHKSEQFFFNGMVMNTKLLGDMLIEVLDLVDHKNLNEVSWFKLRPSPSTTVENIVLFFWEQMKAQLNKHQDNITLRQVTIWETDKNYAYID